MKRAFVALCVTAYLPVLIVQLGFRMSPKTAWLPAWDSFYWTDALNAWRGTSMSLYAVLALVCAAVLRPAAPAIVDHYLDARPFGRAYRRRALGLVAYSVVVGGLGYGAYRIADVATHQWQAELAAGCAAVLCLFILRRHLRWRLLPYGATIGALLLRNYTGVSLLLLMPGVFAYARVRHASAQLT